MVDERPNYYLLLELDPSVQDPVAIETAVKAKKLRWSTESLQGSAASRRKARVNLSRLTEICRVMADPEFRSQEAADAHRRLQMQHHERLRELDGKIAMLRAGGRASREGVALIVKNLDGRVTEKEVIERLAAAGLAIDKPPAAAPGTAAAKPRLDPARMDQLRPSLQLLKHRNLYELLDMTPRSSPRSLRDRADEENRKELRDGKTDPMTSARKELYGACLALFALEEEKQKYDNALAFEAMEGLRNTIELAGIDAFITTEQQNELVKQARALGVEADDARAYLEQFAKNRKWGLQQAGKLPAEDLPLCGLCGTLASAAAKRCHHCGEALVISCPCCSTAVPTARTACERCGCRIGDASVVKSLLREGQQRAGEGDAAAALAAFDRALVYWSDWAPLVAARQEALSRREARDRALREVDGLIQARRLIEARAALERVRRDWGQAGTETQHRKVEEAITRAEKLSAEADALRGADRTDEAVTRYEQALEGCADLAAARDALAAIPPAAPQSLEVISLSGGFRLTWRATPAAGRRRHLVVRKEQSRPRRPDDGTLVGETTGLELDDLRVAPGTPYCWAVFTARGEAVSREAATVGPCLLAVNVAELRVFAADREIALHWARPHGCERVEIWRKTGAPPDRRGEGVRVSASDDGAQDGPLRNGEAQGYLVVAVYPDPARPGAELFAPGLSFRATAAPPPPSVLDLRAERTGASITLRWTAPPGHVVQLRRGTRPPESPPGTVLPLSAAERLGRLVDVASPGSVQVPLDQQGKIVFTPLTVSGANAVVGQSATVMAIDDVTDLRSRSNGSDILLTWQWPGGAEEVVVSHAPDHHPSSPAEAGASSALVQRAAYQRANGWVLRAFRPMRHFITVFVKSGDLHSPGARVVETMGHDTIVRYRVGVKKSGLLGRTIEAAWLDLECADPLPGLPAVVALGKNGQQPLSPSDGTLLVEVAEVHFRDGRARIDIPRENVRPSLQVKLFFKDGRHAREIRLLPGAENELRLG